MTTEVVVVNSTSTVVSENTQTNTIEITAQGPAGPPGGALTIQDEGVSEGLLTDKINFVGSTVSVANDTINEIATITVNAADPGANANITSMTGITGGISTADFVQFDTAAVGTGAIGKLLWNDTDGTLEFQMKGGNVTLQIGQEQVLRVTNQYGSTISDGQAVYITGSTGNHLNVTLAQGNTEAASSKTLAIVTEPIANNQSGFATTSGLVRNFNTSALTEGAAIWLSPTVPGGLTSTKPVAPDNSVLIGWCVRQHATVGVIYVHISNGYELEELHNVLITAASNNQVLRYDSATGLWKNATISPTVTLAGAVTGSSTMTDLGSVTITTTATSDPTLTLSGDASGSATFTNLGDATLAVTVSDNSHNHTIANVTGLQTELDTKAPLASPAFTGTVTLPSTTSVGTVSATEIGYLDGVTSGIQAQIDTKLDSSSYTAADILNKIKTVDGSGSGLDADLLDGQSSAYYTAINDRLGYTAENTANKGVAGGYAALDGAGLVPSTQLPSYVDDVLEYANTAAFPVTGETGKIYVAIDTSKTYRWSGSVYVEISASPGSTDAVPEGATNLYFTTSRARQSVSAGTGISYNNSTGVITNSAPDQTVAITGSGTTSVTGTYPNFTVSSGDAYTGTVTSVAASGGTTGLTFSGGPITTSGTLTLAGTLGVANGGTGQTSYTNGQLLIGNTTGNTLTKATLTAGTNVSITNGAGSITINATDQYTGTVTSVAASGGTTGLTFTGSPITTSGTLTLAGTLNVANGGTGATTLTSGYLVKGNGVYAVSASIIYDNGTNVGIGTSSPGPIKALGDRVVQVTAPSGKNAMVLTTAATGGAALGLYSLDGSTESGLYSNVNGPMLFWTNSSERMRIDASGNVGIGATAPWEILSVPCNNGIALGSSTYSFKIQRNSAGELVTTFSDTYDASTARVDFTMRSGSAAQNTPLSILGSGNVGIGTSSPGAKLSVNDPGTGLGFTNAASGNFNIGLLAGTGSADAYVYQRANNPLIFGTSNTERMRIDGSGNLLVGTTTTNPTNGFVVNPNGGNGLYLQIGHPTGTGSGVAYERYMYNQTEIGSITQNGTTAVAYNTTSDYRLKTVDGPITNSGAYIDALKPVQGSWKVDGSRFIGLIAHEVQEVSETQIATGVKDGDEMQAMDYSAPELIANLIAEIQSLRARVAQLEGK